MQIKTMKKRFTAIRTAVINTQAMTTVGEDGEKLEPLYFTGRIVKWYSCCAKQFGSSLKCFKHSLLYSLVYTQENRKHLSAQKLVHDCLQQHYPQQL